MMRTEATLLEACRRAPEAAASWGELGAARARNGDWPAALGAYVEAGRLAPDSLAFALARG
ncbi:MAG: tetratricopeptide repeat protein, partial [Acetobacteraceae bacterium]